MEKWVESLEYDINHYDKVILFTDRELLLKFYKLKFDCLHQQKLLILSSEQIIPEAKNFTFRMIKEEEIRNLRNLYFTYEFSDNFIFISVENENFATLYNFVNVGIISVEEMFEILLH